MPTEQDTQAEAPVLPWYSPWAQIEQTNAAAGEYKPEAQLSQEVTATEEYLPALQRTQLDEPEFG